MFETTADMTTSKVAIISQISLFQALSNAQRCFVALDKTCYIQYNDGDSAVSALGVDWLSRSRDV